MDDQAGRIYLAPTVAAYLIFGLLAQVASRPSVQTHPYFIAQYIVPIPLFSLLYCKAILFGELLLYNSSLYSGIASYVYVLMQLYSFIHARIAT